MPSLAWVYSFDVLYLDLTPMLAVAGDRRLTAFAVILVVIVGLWALNGSRMVAAATLGGPLWAAYAAPR